jgi:hypothetical protein
MQMEILSQMKNSLYNTHNVRMGFGKRTKTPSSFSQLQVERLLQTNKITRKMNELKQTNINDGSVLTDSDEDMIFIEHQEVVKSNKQKLKHIPTRINTNTTTNIKDKNDKQTQTPNKTLEKEAFYFLKSSSTKTNLNSNNTLTPTNSGSTNTTPLKKDDLRIENLIATQKKLTEVR